MLVRPGGSACQRCPSRARWSRCGRLLRSSRRLACALARVHTHAKRARRHARVAHAHAADVRVRAGACVFECEVCVCASVSHPHDRDEGGQPGGGSRVGDPPLRGCRPSRARGNGERRRPGNGVIRGGERLMRKTCGKTWRTFSGILHATCGEKERGARRDAAQRAKHRAARARAARDWPELRCCRRARVDEP